VRTDTSLPQEFTASSEWEENRYDRNLFYGRYSFSGNERNHLFINREGVQFDDVSPLSGLDTSADSRAFAYLDYDRDGWQDIALVNANTPLFTLYRNAMAGTPHADGRRGIVALRFVGGNTEGRPATGLAPRDGYGAVAEIHLPDQVLEREHRCGEGFAAQNSATMVVGIGGADVVPRIVVRWPSGHAQEILDVPEGSLLTVYEDAHASPDGSGVTRTSYRGAGEPATASRGPRLELAGGDEDAPKVRMYMAMDVVRRVQGVDAAARVAQGELHGSGSRDVRRADRSERHAREAPRLSRGAPSAIRASRHDGPDRAPAVRDVARPAGRALDARDDHHGRRRHDPEDDEGDSDAIRHREGIA